MEPDATETLLRWSRDRLVAAAGGGAPLLVADSWLVADGVERAAAAHWARFAAACAAHGVAAATLTAFERAASDALPRAGRWFPRVELTGDGLALRLRRAPAPAGGARVVVAPPGDPRRQPRVKGPDLDRLVALRAAACERGADELLLRDARGALREGALSSLLWWEDDALCTTPPQHTLPGVTRALLLARARELGVELRERAPRPHELAGREVWLTSALHGIRVVTAWLDPRQEAGPARRAERWRAALDARPATIEAGGRGG